MIHLHFFKASALIRVIYILLRVPPFPFSVMGAAATCQLPYIVNDH